MTSLNTNVQEYKYIYALNNFIVRKYKLGVLVTFWKLIHRIIRIRGKNDISYQILGEYKKNSNMIQPKKKNSLDFIEKEKLRM